MKRSIFLAAALILAACKDSPTGPDPQTPSVVAITSPQTVIVVGATVNLTATVYDQAGKKITNAVVTWKSLTPTVATVSGSGVVTGVATGQVTIEASSSGRTGSITLTVDPDPCTNPISLSAGQVRMLSGPTAVACITLAPTTSSSDYLFITANAEQTQDQTAVYSVVLSTGNVAGMAAAIRAMAFDPQAYAEIQAIQMVDRVEDRLRAQGRDLFKRVHPAVRDGVARESGSGAALALSAAIAVEGDTITIRVPDIHSSNLCTTGYKDVRAVVKKTTAHATIAQDIAAPTPGFSANDFTEIGNEFESLIYPTDTLYFGHESDRNADGRVTILYTPEVNRATPSGATGFVAGFFWPGDLVKKTEYQQLGIECPQTNEQEVFYMLVADPSGTINSNPRSVAVVRQNTRGTIAHEFQHMINQGRRLLNPAVDSSETTWLNEALSHIAEEVVGRAKRGFGDFQKLTYNDVNPNPTSPDDYQAFFRQNLLRYRSWMQRPDTSSPTSNSAGAQLAPRGAAWMLLRYASDFHSGGNMKAFLRRVVGGPDIGLRNLLQHSGGAQFDDLLSGWLISQFTDGLNIPGLPARYNMASWAVRDAMAGANGNVFPLLVTPLPASISTKSISGSGNYFRLTRVGASPQTTFRMQSQSGSSVSFAGARVYVVRIN
ncbi:MAG TPA: Ig-like domain-containing protein [Gemmatimonadaceae bacterium]